ncbi:MAG: ABC transporter ATP-binding protein [Bauldia sp.]|nr:ABC transporter ATP-binding protein [Bauldia sp.]
MTDTRPVVDIDALSVVLHRDGRANRVLDNVALSLGAGEIVALVGESGSGKSTLGLAIQGLLPDASEPKVEGSILLASEEVVGARPARLRELRHRTVRAVSQDPMGALDPTMTIGAQMREAARDPAEIPDWLTRIGLPDPARIVAAYPHALSGGQRQRVLIAMAMSARPALLIADEPTTALDVTVQAQILDLIRTLCREEGTAVLFITHDLGVASVLADRVVVLYGGRVAEIGPTDAMLTRPRHPYTQGLLMARFDLDADKSRPLRPLSGDPPNTFGADDACRFAPRCHLAEAVCRSERPPLRVVDGQPGSVACFFADRSRAIAAQEEATAAWPAMAPVRPGFALEFANVGKTFALGRAGVFGRRRYLEALSGVTFRVERGEAVALVGESGSGKSTVLRLAAGLIEPDTGDVALGDSEPPQMIFQDATASLTPWLTAGEQIGERLRMAGKNRAERRARVIAALETVGLDGAFADARPSELSGGQCQRVAVARAIVVPPSLLLCDEPISAMDMSSAAQTLNLLGELRRRMGMPMLFVTHDLAAARFIADRIIVMRSGRIVEEGTADTVVSTPREDYTRDLLAAVPAPGAA